MTGQQSEYVTRGPVAASAKAIAASSVTQAGERSRGGAGRLLRWLRLGLAWCCLLAGVGTAYWLGWSPAAPSPAPQAPVLVRKASPSRPAAESGVRLRRIQDVRVGQRLLGRNPQREGVEHLAEPDPASWRELELHLRKRNGRRLEMVLLRPQEWLAVRATRAGGRLWLDLPEMGAQGWATVVAVRPCPPIEPGPGCVVTGTFKHEPDDNVLAVHVEGLSGPIGVTDTHPFWSEDRQAFVPVGQLRVGEGVRTRLAGVTRITAITRRPGVDWVYNLEVHGEHVYEVSPLGLLVHNDNTVKLGQAGTPGQPNAGPKRSALIRQGQTPGTWEVKGKEYPTFEEAAKAAGVPLKGAPAPRPVVTGKAGGGGGGGLLGKTEKATLAESLFRDQKLSKEQGEAELAKMGLTPKQIRDVKDIAKAEGWLPTSNRAGNAGRPEVQEQLKDLQERLEAEGWTVEKEEYLSRTPGTIKGSNKADLLASKAEGERVRIQTIDTNKPSRLKRELDNAGSILELAKQKDGKDNYLILIPKPGERGPIRIMKNGSPVRDVEAGTSIEDILKALKKG